LGSCRNLILAPDGDLNLAPLGILPLERGDRTLRDRYAINSVSSGRELLRNNIDLERQPGPALTVGAPNYDLGSSGGNGATVGSSDKLAATLADCPFRHIPETGDLAAAVAQRLDAKALLGDDALVAELLARRSPKVLLVATHGFFFQKRGRQDYYQLVRALLNCPNGEEEKILQRHEQLLDKELLEVMAEVATQLAENDNEEAANRLRELAEDLEDEINDTAPPPDSVYRLDAKVEDPMLRAGIALAGANTWSWGGELPPEAGTGVMFARDVAALDLLATELVILVACQSGLGEVATGEGVFGLRRAVAVAGAKNLIMSLWSVPAYATILLMERLFDYIDAGWQPAEALELAQDYLKNVTIGELNESKLGKEILRELGIFIGITRKTHPLEMKPLEHPYYWAAWVCQGVLIDN
jgi:CHAT domain-containing protein